MPGFFKRQQAESANDKVDPGGPVISALLLEGMTFPLVPFLKEVRTAQFADRVATQFKRSEGDVISFNLGDEMVAIVQMPAPYPAADLEGPIATCWMWPKQPPIANVKRHRSHLLVTMMGGAADPVRRRLIMTAVTALAAKQPGVMAICWPEGTLVHYPPVFIEMSEKINRPEAPPLYLWVDLRAFRNEDGTTGLFTTGLPWLGHMEIEIPRISMSPGELREWTLNIICYLLDKGPVLKHGQTIGITAQQKIRIRHCPSSFGHKGTVIRLEP